MRAVFGTLAGTVASVTAALVVGLTPAIAAGDYTLFGGASITTGYQSPTGIELTSVGPLPNPSYSGIDFAVPSGLTLAGIDELSAEYDFIDNTCGGGSPRFQLNVSTATGTKNVFVYIGSAPSYDECAQGWNPTGNLADDANLVDASQIGGGVSETFADVKATYGSMSVTGIQLVADGGWAFPDLTQTVAVDNVVINSTTYTFESAATCKDSGWEAYGGEFKNQGDCVSYFATGGVNSPSGT